MSKKLRARHLMLAALLLTAMFGLAVGSSAQKSPTFDEGFYISRGWAFLKTGHLLPLGHPPFTNLLSGAGVLLEPDLTDPTTLDGWADNDPEAFSEDFLWHQGINTNRVVFLARLPLIYLGLLLGTVIWRWAREDYGRWCAVLALTLYTFSPNILAHTRLAATDLGIAAFYVGTLYAWTRYWRARSWRWLIISGVMFGLAQASKFSGLFLLPTLGLMTVWYAARKQKNLLPKKSGEPTHEHKAPLVWLWSSLAALIIMGLIGIVTLWATNLFGVRPYPLSGYVSELMHFFDLAAEGHRAYLLGHFSQTGWWYYHPLTLALKMPLPSLIMLLLAALLAVGREIKGYEWEIIFPTLVYLGITMFGSLNVGIRYLLPILPLLFIFSSRIGSGPLRSGWLRYGVLFPLTMWVIASGLWSYPHYISFFNLASGGPNRGYQLLSDSNVDWGQDLPGLAAWLEDRGAGQIYLSYFGQADPSYYGIDYIALPGWPPPEPDPDRPVFNPMNPEPGLYAISASNLVGVQLYEPDTFGYFRAREPIAQVGHSILIYQVDPKEKEPGGWFAQCAAPDSYETEAKLEELTGIEELNHIYFDCQQTLPFPNTPGWLLLPADISPVIDIGEPDYLARLEDGTLRYRVWMVNKAPPSPPQSIIEFPQVKLPLPIAGYVELLGYQVEQGTFAPGETLTLTAWWSVREPPPPPVSIFAHLLAPDGSLIQAADALGIPAEDWERGMVIIQQHRFVIPEDAPPGSAALTVGLYSLSTGERFPISQSGERVVDRVVLRNVTIGE